MALDTNTSADFYKKVMAIDHMSWDDKLDVCFEMAKALVKIHIDSEYLKRNKGWEAFIREVNKGYTMVDSYKDGKYIIGADPYKDETYSNSF